jgi:hypothetical protein
MIAQQANPIVNDVIDIQWSQSGIKQNPPFLTLQ